MRLLSVLALLVPGLAFGADSVAPAAWNHYKLEGTPGYEVALPAQPVGSLIQEGRLFVALGANGVAIFDLSSGTPMLVGTRTFDGEAYGLTLVDGSPWVLLRQRSARPLLDDAAASPGSPMPTPASSARASFSAGGTGAVGAATGSQSAAGEVAQVGPGYAILNRGLADGLAAGDRIRILTRLEIDAADLGLTGEKAAYREVESAVGEIETIGPDRSRVELVRGGRAHVGDRFERVAESGGGHLIAPGRVGGITELSAVVRPFLAVGTLGLGSINEVALSYVGEKPYFAEARLHPLTAGWSRDGNLLGISAMVAAGYDHRFFAAGLGVGFTAANSGITDTTTRYDTAAEDGASSTFSFEEVNEGVSLGQIVRLGSRDGLHLELRNTFVLGTVEVYEGGYTYDPETGQEIYETPRLKETYLDTRWSSTRGRLVVPAARVTDLFTEIGGGAGLYFFNVEAGVQTWLRGNGDQGSLGISVAAGFGLMQGSPEDESIELAGPLVSVGVRKRW